MGTDLVSCKGMISRSIKELGGCHAKVELFIENLLRDGLLASSELDVVNYRCRAKKMGSGQAANA